MGIVNEDRLRGVVAVQWLYLLMTIYGQIIFLFEEDLQNENPLSHYPVDHPGETYILSWKYIIVLYILCRSVPI